MSSTGADFRGLTPLVLMSALQQAGTLCTSRSSGSGWRCRRTCSGTCCPPYPGWAPYPRYREILGPSLRN